MGEHCDYANVKIKIEGEFTIAPIHLHYLLGNLTELMRVLSELEKNGGHQRNITTMMELCYAPVQAGDHHE